MPTSWVLPLHVKFTINVQHLEKTVVLEHITDKMSLTNGKKPVGMCLPDDVNTPRKFSVVHIYAKPPPRSSDSQCCAAIDSRESPHPFPATLPSPSFRGPFFKRKPRLYWTCEAVREQNRNSELQKKLPDRSAACTHRDRAQRTRPSARNNNKHTVVMTCRQKRFCKSRLTAS